jgi:hypothetical protein
MLRETVKDDIIFTVYLCQTCQDVMNERSGEDFCEGDLYELSVEAEAEKALAERENNA